MKPSLLVLPIIFALLAASLQSTKAQTQTIGLNSYYGAIPNDKFSYQNEDLGNYSLGWYQTANATEFRVSGYDGVKLFTNRTPSLSILKNGFVGIGRENPKYLLEIRALGNNQELFRLSHPSSPNNAGFSIGFAADKDGVADRVIDFKVQYSDIKYNVLQIDRYSRDFFYVGEGNVGIGTDNPSEKLDIKADTDNQDLLRLSHPTSPDRAGFTIGFGANAAEQNNYGIDFKIDFSGEKHNVLQIDRASRDFSYVGDGNVGIGTNTPDSKLAVNGVIHAKEVKVDLNGWSDFVFDDDYKLKTLEEVEKHITEKGHLSEMPSEAEVMQNGINLGEMDAKLLQKIEELTLYVIEQNKLNQAQQEELEAQTALIKEMQKEIKELKNN